MCFIHPQQIKQLWPSANVDVSVSADTPPKYVQVAKKVYQALTHPHMAEKAIGMSQKQIKDSCQTESSSISVIKFDDTQIQEIKNITLTISMENPSSSSKSFTWIFLEDLRECLAEASRDRVIDPNDRFYIEVHNHRFWAEVSDIRYEATSSDLDCFGKMGPNTIIHFTPAPTYPLYVVEKSIYCCKNEYVFNVSLTKPKYLDNGSSILDIEELRGLLFKDKYEFVQGEALHFSYNNRWNLTLSLSSIKDKTIDDKKVCENLDSWKASVDTFPEYPKAYMIHKQSLVEFTPAAFRERYASDKERMGHPS